MAHVLAIDDDPDVLLLVRLLLERDGHTVAEGRTGREAVEGVRAHQPDLVVLDVGLPDVDGVTALSRIRGFSRVPVLLLTAHASERDEQRGLRAGADAFLSKPFGAESFAGVIAGLLDERVREETASRPGPSG